MNINDENQLIFMILVIYILSVLSILLPIGIFLLYCVKNVLLYKNSINQTYYDYDIEMR